MKKIRSGARTALTTFAFVLLYGSAFPASVFKAMPMHSPSAEGAEYLKVLVVETDLSSGLSCFDEVNYRPGNNKWKQLKWNQVKGGGDLYKLVAANKEWQNGLNKALSELNLDLNEKNAEALLKSIKEQYKLSAPAVAASPANPPAAVFQSRAGGKLNVVVSAAVLPENENAAQAKTAKISIMDVNGKLLMEKQVSTGLTHLKLPKSLRKGLYVYSITYGGKLLDCGKIQTK
jgi:hypothetical protein